MGFGVGMRIQEGDRKDQDSARGLNYLQFHFSFFKQSFVTHDGTFWSDSHYSASILTNPPVRFAAQVAFEPVSRSASCTHAWKSDTNFKS